MNSFRIAVTGALVQAYGVKHAEGALHFFEGWVVFLLCLLALFGVVVIFSFTARPRRSPLELLGAPELSPTKPSRGSLSRFGALAAIAGGTLAFLGISQFASTDSLTIPKREMFAKLPQELPDWQAQILPMDPTVAEVLGADDTLVANFVSPDGDLVNLYVAYLEAQRDGRSWHSPRQCIPGGGWQIEQHDIVERTLADGTVMKFNRLLIQNRDYRQLVYYWYDQRGRKIANEFTMKFWLIYDAVAHKRSDGALVRLITPVNNQEGIEGADHILEDMMNRVEQFLPAYVPN